MSNCQGHPDCSMTAGYCLGGGMWICWLHALFSRGMMTAIAKTEQKLQALPKQQAKEFSK